MNIEVYECGRAPYDMVQQVRGNVVDWQTEVAIDITGFPPHAFDPNSLGPLLERRIRAYGFNEARGMRRVDAYALSTEVPFSYTLQLHCSGSL
jgi:hypothetical protein